MYSVRIKIIIILYLGGMCSHLRMCQSQTLCLHMMAATHPYKINIHPSTHPTSKHVYGLGRVPCPPYILSMRLHFSAKLLYNLMLTFDVSNVALNM